MNYEDAVASQPANLDETREIVREALAAQPLAPWSAGTLAVVAMGASTHAGWLLVERLRAAGRRADNLAASTVMDAASPASFADSYVLVSEGGRSRETVAAARCLAGAPRLGLTNAAASPFLENVDVPVVMGHGADSAVYTVGYTATLQAFGLFAEAVGAGSPDEDFAALPERMRPVLDGGEALAARCAGRLAELQTLDFVGSGAAFASASEAALLFRESTRTPTAAFETYQYLHGPMESLAAGRGCVLFGDGREVELARYLAEREIFVLLVTAAEIESTGSLVVTHVPATAPVTRAVLEILPLQVLAGVVARGRGLGIDGFVYHQDDTKLPG